MSQEITDARSIVLKKRGTKQTCENADCNRRFYDLQRTPLSCPYCGATFDRPAPPRTVLEIMNSQQGRKRHQWSKPTPPVAVIEPVDAGATESISAEGGGPLLELEDDSVEPANGEQDDDEADAA